MIWLAFGLLLLLLVATLAIGLWVSANQRWQARAESAHLDREVRRAEHRLHNLASDAFASMLDAARRVSPGEWQR